MTPCTQCADAGHYAWHDSLNDRETLVMCGCAAGLAQLRKEALARVEKYGRVSGGVPLTTLAISRIVHDELVRDGLIEQDASGAPSPHIDAWQLTEKGRAL